MRVFKLGRDKIDLNVLERFLKGDLSLSLSQSVKKKINGSRAFVENLLAEGRPIYGVNTGFGRLAVTRITPDKLEELQVNLVRSHACGIGDPFPEEVVRLILFLKAHGLALGYSGVRLPVITLLAAMLEKNIHPVIPSKGSVGASGDLAPLAHLALAMIGEGEVHFGRKIVSSKGVFRRTGLRPLTLKPKEGLALVNGTQVTTALAALALLKARSLIQLTDIAAALSVEGIRGSPAPFDPDIQKVRGQAGQAETAAVMRRLLKGSRIIASHAGCSRVQDPYSFRCIPQVVGAVRDTFSFVRGIVERETNGVSDNPLVFADRKKIVSGGNFHAEAVAMALDALSIAVAELGSISERRIEQLTNPKAGDLPVMFLTKDPGLNSGFMIPHVTASALVSENKTLAHPASVDSIPTSAGQEDHVSMGPWAATKTLKIIENVEWITAIEVLAACQAIDLHEKRHRPGAGTCAAYDCVRGKIGFMDRDRSLAGDIKVVKEMSEELVKIVGEIVEGL